MADLVSSIFQGWSLISNCSCDPIGRIWVLHKYHMVVNLFQLLPMLYIVSYKTPVAKNSFSNLVFMFMLQISTHKGLNYGQT